MDDGGWIQPPPTSGKVNKRAHGVCYEGAVLARNMTGTDELSKTVNELLESPGGLLLLDIKSHLRKRMKLLAFVFGLIFVACFPFTSNVISWLIAEDRLPNDVNIIVITPVEFILLQVRLAAYCAAFVVLAILIVEGAWRGGKNPALKMRLDELKANAPKPTKGAIGTFLAVIVLGGGGIAYAWNLLIPMLLEYLTIDAQNAGLATQWRLASYVGFVANLAVASAIGFQAPVATLLVLRLEVITRSQVRRYRRHIWFTAFVLGAFLSPPDPLSLFLVAMPVIILFEFALMFDAVTRKSAS
jgi:sec-independent protein translocase protein TatC